MKPDLGRLRIVRLIVHDIPDKRGLAAGETLRLSDGEMHLTPTLTHTVCERIATSLKSAASHVVFDGTSTSPVPRLVSDTVRNGSSDLVQASQEMALHLNDI